MTADVKVQRAAYEHGISTVPLLGETIGANLAATVARVARPDAP